MMNRKTIVTAIVAALMLGAVSAHAAPQTTCPVMGGKVDKSLHVDANGKRIYVCCKDCINTVKANPEKYIKQMEDKGIVLEQVGPAHAMSQTTCPVMGGKINKSLYVDANGKRIYVCCGMCINTVKANPEKYIKQMEDKGIVLEQVGPETKSGEDK